MATHSVIVPVLNGARYIGECMDSALAQLGPDDELIVVDNGSTDTTVAIVEAYAGRGVTLLHEEKRGPAAARNAGLRRATGDFVSFLDSDDVWPEGRLESMVTALDAAPELDAVYGRMDLIYDRFEPRFEHLRGQHVPLSGVWSYLFRRRILDRAGPLDESLIMGEDIDYLLRLREAGMKSAPLDACVLNYRRHDTNMTLIEEVVRQSLMGFLVHNIARRRRVKDKAE